MSTVATFTRAGTYTFMVTISDGSLTVTSSVSLTVSATLTAVTVSGNASVAAGNTAQFTVAALDPIQAGGFQAGAASVVDRCRRRGERGFHGTL